MKVAVLQVADTGPLESLVVMLQSVGYRCLLPDANARVKLRSYGCESVLDIKQLVDSWGYDWPMGLNTASMRVTERADLYVDVKAHRNGPLIWKHHPSLRKKTLWYRINGGKPEHVIRADGFDCGDEVNPPCPVLTPNQWYGMSGEARYEGQDDSGHLTINYPTPWREGLRNGRFYVCWPPFHRKHEYYDAKGRPSLSKELSPPVCLIHNAAGWGYGDIFDHLRSQCGLRIYGVGSPDGLVNHRDIPEIFANTLCMIHLKSKDAPGYAIYEGMSAACPIICSRRLIWRCRMENLLIPGVTCLTFDRETHDALSQADAADCVREIRQHVERLKDPAENFRIGMAGRMVLESLMWRQDKDSESLGKFLELNFGGQHD